MATSGKGTSYFPDCLVTSAETEGAGAGQPQLLFPSLSHERNQEVLSDWPHLVDVKKN
jgi:hypothetical protein